MALSAVKTTRSDSSGDSVREYSLYINGAWTAGSGTMAEDFNPATGALFARVAQANRADALKAVEAAYGARQSRTRWPRGRRFSWASVSFRSNRGRR